MRYIVTCKLPETLCESPQALARVRDRGFRLNRAFGIEHTVMVTAVTEI